jgi:hypothetical protein
MGFSDFFKKALKAGNMVFGDGISRQVQHDYRLAEMAQENKYQTTQLELRNNQNRDLQIIMHELRIDFERARRRMDNSPFYHDDLDTADLLWQAFKESRKPLFLVSPFWDETQTNTSVDAGGGGSSFRTAISGAWHDLQYSLHGVCLDGVFKRPLRQTDVDIRWIRNILKDLPVIVAYGYSDGKSIYPMIATWNILPNAGRDHITTFHGKALLPGKRDDDAFRQHIGEAMTGIAGAVMGVTDEGKSLFREQQTRLSIARGEASSVSGDSGTRAITPRKPPYDANQASGILPYDRKKRAFDP